MSTEILEKELNQKREQLKKAYLEMEQDLDQHEIVQEWSILDTEDWE